jgi:hypothetical protein
LFCCTSCIELLQATTPIVKAASAANIMLFMLDSPSPHE